MAIFNADSLDKTFHALGDASRRQMLSAIREHQRCTAGELVRLFESSQPTISKHLKVLENAQLVQRHVEGRNHYFELNRTGISAAEAWMQRHMAFWNHSLDRLDQFLDNQ